MKRKLSLTAAVLALALAAAVAAQTVSEMMQVTIVEVPVTVVDRDGNAVRGLTAANFELTDDGKRVPIEYFEVLDLPALAAEQKRDETPLPPAATRHFLIMFDLANSSPGTIVRSGEAAKQFVEEQLGERDLAAVSVFTAEAGARMITNFTRNRALLVNAIETLGHPKYFKVADPLMISAQPPSERAMGEGKSGIEAAFNEIVRDSNASEQNVRDTEMQKRLRIQMANMSGVARALDRLKGQKQIILLSEGFDAKLVQGREDLSQESTRSETDSVLSGEVWNVNTDNRYGNTTSSREIQEMVEIFRRSDVVLHAIDIKGLRGGAGDASSAARGSTKSGESLFLITQPTGGTVFKNANDMTENFGKLMKQQEVVYVLGFKARTSGKPGKFHALKVKTVNTRGIARIAHRTGYYEPSKMTDLERALTIAEILMMDAPINDINVRTTATTLPGPGGKARVPVIVEIPGPKLLESLTGTTANVDLFLYAFDKNSQVIDFLQQRVSLDTTKAGDTLRAGGMRFFGTLRLPPGEYAVKTAVRVEESGLIGVDRKDVTVPTFQTAAVMPPVFLSEPGSWAMVLGQPRGDDYPYPFAVGQTKYIARRNAEVTGNGEYKVALFLYRMPAENLSVTPTVVNSAGASLPAEIKLLGRTSPDEQGMIKLLFNFKPQSIAAGNHELRFDVKAKDGTQSVVTLPFTVQ